MFVKDMYIKMYYLKRLTSCKHKEAHTVNLVTTKRRNSSAHLEQVKAPGTRGSKSIRSTQYRGLLCQSAAVSALGVEDTVVNLWLLLW